MPKFEYKIKIGEEVCDVCGGTGILYRPKKVVDKETGEEKVETEEIACPKCGGAGKMDKYQKVEFFVREFDGFDLMEIENMAWIPPEEVGGSSIENNRYRRSERKFRDTLFERAIVRTNPPEFKKNYTQYYREYGKKVADDIYSLIFRYSVFKKLENTD